MASISLLSSKTPSSRIIKGTASWPFQTDKVRTAVTVEGGHLGPVAFRVGSRWVEPMHVAPWHSEKLPKDVPPLLRVLRSDFFCAPFGGSEPHYRGERHPAHGETAQRPWQVPRVSQGGGLVRFEAQLETKVRPGLVRKQIELRKGESVIYQRHTMEGYSGLMSPGHHANLYFRDGDGTGRITTSRFIRGQVQPGQFENPVLGGYSALKPGALFKNLRQVPCIDGSTTDLTRYPSREGFEDITMVCTDPKLEFGWTAAVFLKERFVWFALKDPRVLASTVFWMSNGGRHYAPWNGRHRHVIGVEEVTSYFALGLVHSAKPNPVSREGIPTVLRLHPKKPLTVNYIIGVAAVPNGFEEVADIVKVAGGVSLRSTKGHEVFAPVRTEFLQEASV